MPWKTAKAIIRYSVASFGHQTGRHRHALPATHDRRDRVSALHTWTKRPQSGSNDLPRQAATIHTAVTLQKT